jgi:hypothetical protein
MEGGERVRRTAMQRSRALVAIAIIAPVAIVAVVLALRPPVNTAPRFLATAPNSVQGIKQVQALADGQVTTVELYHLAQQYVTCIETLGISAVAQFNVDQQTFEYHFQSAHDVEPRLESAAGQRCYDRTIAVAQYRWADAHPDRPNDMGTFFDVFTECVLEHGIARAIASTSDLQALNDDHPEIVAACYDHAYERSFVMPLELVGTATPLAGWRR